MIERTIDIGTDVATLLLFHPGDLHHRAQAPTGWYGHGFAYHRDSAAGRLIAWSTGGDGGYQVRVTAGSLSAAEQACACGRRAFPLLVRHGRVLLDNSDALPGEGQMEEPGPDSDQWIEVPDGAYRVTVHALDRAGDDHLPDYVAAFAAVDGIEDIPVEHVLPVLEPFGQADEQQVVPDRDGDAVQRRLQAETEAPYLWQSRLPEAVWRDVFAVAEDVSIVPGGTHAQAVPDEVAEHFYPQHAEPAAGPVLATAAAVGGLALAARINGRSWLAGRGSRITVQATAVVRIVEVDPSASPSRVRVEAVGRPDMAADPAAVAALRAHLLAQVRAREDAGETTAATAPAFELERLEVLESAEAVTGWALTHLAMPLDERLALWCAPVRERIAAIEAMLPR